MRISDWSSGVCSADLGLDLAIATAEAVAEPSAPFVSTARASDDPLTTREREVVALLAEGLGNKAIATELGITAKTAMHHTSAIYRKLGVRGRSEAAAWAVRHGLRSEERRVGKEGVSTVRSRWSAVH